MLSALHLEEAMIKGTVVARMQKSAAQAINAHHAGNTENAKNSHVEIAPIIAPENGVGHHHFRLQIGIDLLIKKTLVRAKE